MNGSVSKGHLSPARRRLVELMQDINFGRIERLQIRGGDPVLKPAPRVVRDWKFGGENGPRPERQSDDFALKQRLLDLFAMLDHVGDTVIDVLEVKHGLPFLASVPEAG